MANFNQSNAHSGVMHMECFYR